MRDPASFAVGIQNFVDKTNRKLERMFREVNVEIGTKIVQRTPVKEGVARANWQVAIGSVPKGFVDLNDVSGQATISKITARLARVKPGDKVYFSNHAPYIRRLEYGWSKQAPQGMVRITVAEFRHMLRQASARVR